MCIRDSLYTEEDCLMQVILTVSVRISIHFLYTEEDTANKNLEYPISISIHFLYTEEDQNYITH